MPLVNITHKKTRLSYTREEDEIIKRLADQNISTEEIAQTLQEAGFDRTEESVVYRIANVLSKVYSFDDINYDNERNQ